MSVQESSDNSRRAVEEIFASWKRHNRILANISGLIGPEEAAFKTAESESPVFEHLCHIHAVRHGWLSRVSPQHTDGLGEVYLKVGESAWEPITDPDEVKRQIALSETAVLAAVESLIAAGAGQVGPYSHPVHFLQHMLWHEAGHVAVISLALRLNGKEPSDEWEEANMWAVWRS